MSQVVLITNKRGVASKRKPEMGFGYKGVSHSAGCRGW